MPIKIMRTLFGFVVFGYLCAVVVWAQQAQQERVIKPMRLPQGTIEVLETSNLQMDGKPVAFGQKFMAGDDWVKGISFDVKNVNGKIITHFAIETFITGADIQRASAQIFAYGTPVDTPTVRMQPGETIHVRLTDKHYEIFKMLCRRVGVNSLSEITLNIGMVVFDDDTAWRRGYLMRRRADNPMAFEMIGRGSGVSTSSVIPVTELTLKDNVIASIAPQPDAPLVMSLDRNYANEWPKVQVHFRIENRGEKPIRTVSIRHDEVIGKTEKNGLVYERPFTTPFIMKPGQWNVMVFSYNGPEAIGRLVFSVDLVEFEDGTTWGRNAFGSAERIAGRRASAKVEHERLLNALRSGGVAAVLQAITAPASDPPLGHSAEWEKEFRDTVKAWRLLIQRLYNDGGAAAVETVLKNPPASLMR